MPQKTIRNLKINYGANLNGCKEFNHLRISNLPEFFSSYGNNLEYYKAPWKILSELEEQIKFVNNPEHALFVSYKEGGEVIFTLKEMYIEGDLRVVVYEFDTFIS